MIRIQHGPWGIVKVEVKSDRGMFMVRTWVNKIEQMKNVGLEYNEAVELATGLLETRSGELMAAFELVTS